MSTVPGARPADSKITVIPGYDNPGGGSFGLRLLVAESVKRKLYFEFAGGMGDVINGVMTSDIFSRLDDMTPKEKALIVLFCHNPCAPEIFAYHAKASQIVVLSLGSHDCFDAVFRRRHGIFGRPLFRYGPARGPFVPRISDRDRSVVVTLPKRYVTFSASASSGPGEGRSIPKDVVLKMAKLCLSMNLPPVFLGRRYAHTVGRDHAVGGDHGEFDPSGINGAISLIDRLTVPGTLECLRRSVANVTCNSFSMLPSWRMRRPTFLISSPSDSRDFKASKDLSMGGYSFGLAYPENGECCYLEYNDSKLSSFLSRVKP